MWVSIASPRNSKARSGWTQGEEHDGAAVGQLAKPLAIRRSGRHRKRLARAVAGSPGFDHQPDHGQRRRQLDRRAEHIAGDPPETPHAVHHQHAATASAVSTTAGPATGGGLWRTPTAPPTPPSTAPPRPSADPGDRAPSTLPGRRACRGGRPAPRRPGRRHRGHRRWDAGQAGGAIANARPGRPERPVTAATPNGPAEPSRITCSALGRPVTAERVDGVGQTVDM